MSRVLTLSGWRREPWEDSHALHVTEYKQSYDNHDNQEHCHSPYCPSHRHAPPVAFELILLLTFAFI